MSNERIDEFLPWRSRLDASEGVPGHGLADREASWERLMDRLKKRPRGKRFWGYRIAAACLLLALIAAARLFQDRHDRVVVVRPAPRSVPAAEVRTAVPVVSVPTLRSEPVPGFLPREVVRGTRRKVVAGPREREIRVAELVGSPAVVVLSPDSVSISVVAKPLKNKPLRVVNINEISGSAAPSPSVTSAEDNKRFDFSIQPTSLKVKLSSSN